MLTDSQIERYSRQIILPHVGGRGQKKLLSTSVAVIGAGSVGSAAALYLAAAGVGSLTIVDDDDVRWNDQSGEVLYAPASVGKNRAESAATGLEALNPDCRITPVGLRVTADVASGVARDHAVVIDASPTVRTASVLNAACVAAGKPLVWGRVEGFIGHVTTFAGHRMDAPCYDCWDWQAAETSAQADGSAAGLGVTAGFIGSLQAIEVIKILLGIDALLIGRILIYDAFELALREAVFAKDPGCVTCGSKRRMPKRDIAE